MTVGRRGFLKTVLALGVAPYVGRADALMKSCRHATFVCGTVRLGTIIWHCDGIVETAVTATPLESYLAGWGPDPRPSPWTNSERQTIVLASDVAGCRGYRGELAGEPRDGGDCAHLVTAGMAAIDFAPGAAYVCTSATLHESVPLRRDALRTLVRLNVECAL